MIKKKAVEFSKSEDIAEVDQELDAAMERLTETNERIDNVLTGIENPEEEAEEHEGKQENDDLSERSSEAPAGD